MSHRSKTNLKIQQILPNAKNYESDINHKQRTLNEVGRILKNDVKTSHNLTQQVDNTLNRVMQLMPQKSHRVVRAMMQLRNLVDDAIPSRKIKNDITLLNKSIATPEGQQDFKQTVQQIKRICFLRSQAFKIQHAINKLSKNIANHVSGKVIEHNLQMLRGSISPESQAKVFKPNLIHIYLLRNAHMKNKAQTRLLTKGTDICSRGIIRLSDQSFYVIRRHKQDFYLPADKRIVVNAYVQPSDIKPSSQIKVISPVNAYLQAKFKSTPIRTYPVGTLLSYRRLMTITHSHITHFQLLDGTWITANHKYITLI